MAGRCLALFDENPSGPGSLHSQSQRFLSHTWESLHPENHADKLTDPPLRPLMEQLASGEKTIADIAAEDTAASNSFVHWVCAFRHARILELDPMVASMSSCIPL